MKHKPHAGHSAEQDRHGARQPERFNPSRASMLDDQGRFEYLPPDSIFPLLQAPQGGRVVDFGTGTGLFALELARRRPDLQVIALDEQPEMLARLQASPALTGLPNVQVLQSGQLAGLRGAMDAVLAINVLHELGDEATRELAALPESGGPIVVVDWNGAIERPIGPPRDHVYTPAQARARLEEFGLRVLEQPPLPFHFVLVARRQGSFGGREALEGERGSA